MALSACDVTQYIDNDIISSLIQKGGQGDQDDSGGDVSQKGHAEGEHVFGEWETVTAPTCESKGSEHRLCTVCGWEETRDVDMLAHTYNETWSSDATNHWHAATCAHEAMIDLAKHTLVDGVCSVCGWKNESSGLSFVSNGNGTCYVAGIGTCTDTDLVIPRTSPAGDSVTSIGDWAFEECMGLTSITIPDSVTSIGDGAFEGCPGLTSVTIGNSVTSIGSCAFNCCTGLTSIIIPDSVMSIGDGAFSGCTCLTSITVASGNTKYHSAGNCIIETATKTLILGCKNSVIPTDGSVTSIGDWAFDGCSGLTSITIPDSVTSIGGHAFSGCTGLTSVTIPDNVTTIEGYAFSNCTGLTSITIPDIVTSIGSSAFYGCTGLTSVTVPDNVTSIGDWAFDGCTGLTSITIPDSVTSIGGHAFSYCTGLTSVIIPDSVESIGDWAFYDCTGLTSVTIGNNVESIGNGAFYGCYKLIEVCNKSTKFTITAGSSSNGYIGYYAKHIITDETDTFLTTTADGYIFYENEKNVYLMGYAGNDTDLILPATSAKRNDYYAIYQYAFAFRTGLTSITIPDSVESIGYDAFEDCTGLTSVTIGNGVESIGSAAFSGCTGLTSITVASGNTKYHSAGNCIIETATKTLVAGCKNSVIPTDGSVTSIGYSAFWDCTGLTSITIPDSVKSIDNCAFEGCTGLTSITIGNGVTSIGYSAFWDCTGLTSITIPDSVTSIGSSAFYNCTGLTSITIPDSVTSIGYGAFSGCTGLTSVTIGNSVTSIGYGAFSGCTGLTSITIPDSVTSIGSSAFYGCTGLTSITVDAENTKYHSAGNCIIETATKTLVLGCKNSVIPIDGSVTSIGYSAFEGCKGLTSITIPDSVTSIGDAAFMYCTGLISVTYNGTKAQWNAISKGYSWKYNAPFAFVTCTDGTVSP